MCNTHSPLLKTIASHHRIWTVPAIHGDFDRLMSLHNHIYEHFQCGDQMVYHGNYIGQNIGAAACIDEILTFRRLVLSIEGVRPSDITYLKGSQEDLWQRLLSLAFVPNASEIYLWMLSNGVAETLAAYGINYLDGTDACRYGAMGITRWTNSIRDVIRKNAGHEYFYADLKRAAHTSHTAQYPILFVHAGLKADHALSDQGDAFYWGAQSFETMSEAYSPFAKVVRGFDPARNGTNFNCIKATVDDGCGFGGELTSACFTPDGNVEHVLSA